MQNWFECKIKYEKTGVEGKLATVTENYLVDALSHAEAENRIIEEMKPFISGEFKVEKVLRKNIAEIFYNENGDKWYRSRVLFVSLDEEKGVEKCIAVTMIIQANDIKDALNVLTEGMKGTISDYEIYSITETPIIDVYSFKTEEQ